jgi:amidase
MNPAEICFMTAKELTYVIQRKELSVREVMEAHLSQIERINPQVNAIVTLLPERALQGADEADRALSRGERVGLLHGLPIAHKDLILTRGIRTTFGSLAFKDFVPDQDALIVERLRSAGAITIGKTNTPEFGAGSQTFNSVFGVTRNPYDPTKTCGGSSGGAAVALACGMLPIADGSDMGGSLRNPANYCNVVGFRPSPGRVPVWPSSAGWFTLAVEGPMARTVEDAALMLRVIAGPDPRSPISLPESGEVFAAPLERDFQGVRIAWSPDLGELPVDPRVTHTIEAQLEVFDSLGATVEPGHPDFSDADEVFKVLRAWWFEMALGSLLERHRHQLKDTVVWNIEEGRRLTGIQIARAEIKRTALYHRVREFMETYEFLLLPVSQVPPFDLDMPYVEEINGVPMETYIDWMRSCYYISVLGLPAISVPCGFTPEGLPVGLQIVGRHLADLSVLQLAYAFEQATGFWKKRPEMSPHRTLEASSTKAITPHTLPLQGSGRETKADFLS